VKGLQFTYRPPVVKYFNGTTMATDNADDFTRDYEFIEEGSELMVTARPPGPRGVCPTARTQTRPAVSDVRPFRPPRPHAHPLAQSQPRRA